MQPEQSTTTLPPDAHGWRARWFSSSRDTWLPMPEGCARLTAEAQATDPSSVQSLYRPTLALRRSSAAFSGGLTRLPAPGG